ncbi:MAG: hypothetical protein IT579_02430 [Verrucomicrobia subdivision 3 bacterium]|nr:hypothetical protein [Limisphaerales bacterium]
MRGTPYAVSAETAQEFAICTSVPKVRQWLANSLTHVFGQVPDLGGIFTITLSENLTNCFAHGRAELCPNCSKREGWQVVTELLRTYRDGISASNPAAEIVAWDWGWGWVAKGADPEKTISNLPKGVQLLSVSEWGKQYERGGVSLSVAEYSISVVGPGANALDHWAVARRNGIGTLAKVQFNNTWENSAVPYIPVPHLIQEHMENLIKEAVGGLMLSWTLGGYPSPNLDVAKEYFYALNPSKDAVLRKVAVRSYGPAAASSVLQAWETFSRAFKEFPYGVVAGYSIPTQHGPSNPLRLTATGYRAAMILFHTTTSKPGWAPTPRKSRKASSKKWPACGKQAWKTFVRLWPGSRPISSIKRGRIMASLRLAGFTSDPWPIKLSFIGSGNSSVPSWRTRPPFEPGWSKLPGLKSNSPSGSMQSRGRIPPSATRPPIIIITGRSTWRRRFSIATR